MEVAERNVSEEEKYVLEINFGNWESSSGESQEYWLLTLEVAVEKKCIQYDDNNGNCGGTNGDGQNIISQQKIT